MMKTRLAAAELCACFVYLSSSGSFLLISPFDNCKRIYIVPLFIEERLPRNNVDERYCSKEGGREKKESSCIHLIGHGSCHDLHTFKCWTVSRSIYAYVTFPPSADDSTRELGCTGCERIV